MAISPLVMLLWLISGASWRGIADIAGGADAGQPENRRRAVSRMAQLGQDHQISREDSRSRVARVNLTDECRTKLVDGFDTRSPSPAGHPARGSRARRSCASIARRRGGGSLMRDFAFVAADHPQHARRFHRKTQVVAGALLRSSGDDGCTSMGLSVRSIRQQLHRFYPMRWPRWISWRALADRRLTARRQADRHRRPLHGIRRPARPAMRSRTAPIFHACDRRGGAARGSALAMILCSMSSASGRAPAGSIAATGLAGRIAGATIHNSPPSMHWPTGSIPASATEGMSLPTCSAASEPRRLSWLSSIVRLCTRIAVSADDHGSMQVLRLAGSFLLVPNASGAIVNDRGHRRCRRSARAVATCQRCCRWRLSLQADSPRRWASRRIRWAWARIASALPQPVRASAIVAGSVDAGSGLRCSQPVRWCAIWCPNQHMGPPRGEAVATRRRLNVARN
jgi:hypothetical protein